MDGGCGCCAEVLCRGVLAKLDGLKERFDVVQYGELSQDMRVSFFASKRRGSQKMEGGRSRAMRANHRRCCGPRRACAGRSVVCGNRDGTLRRRDTISSSAPAPLGPSGPTLDGESQDLNRSFYDTVK